MAYMAQRRVRRGDAGSPYLVGCMAVHARHVEVESGLSKHVLPSPEVASMGRPVSTVMPRVRVNLRFAQRVIDWHSQHGRHDLPWQKRDPYAIWVSEIMLQQTQVATVIPYYGRFMDAFPDVRAIAGPHGARVLSHWIGGG